MAAPARRQSQSFDAASDPPIGPIQALLMREAEMREQQKQRQKDVPVPARRPEGRRPSVQPLSQPQRRPSSAVSDERSFESTLRSKQSVPRRSTRNSVGLVGPPQSRCSERAANAQRRRSLQGAPVQERRNSCDLIEHQRQRRHSLDGADPNAQFKNFLQRNRNFAQDREQNLEKQRKARAEEAEKVCPFRPETTGASHRETSAPAKSHRANMLYQRGLQDAKALADRRRQRLKELLDNEMAPCSFWPELEPPPAERSKRSTVPQQGPGAGQEAKTKDSPEDVKQKQDIQEDIVMQQDTKNAGVALMCPAGHELETLEAWHTGYSCNICLNMIPKGSMLLGCRACDHNECETCCANYAPPANVTNAAIAAPASLSARRQLHQERRASANAEPAASIASRRNTSPFAPAPTAAPTAAPTTAVPTESAAAAAVRRFEAVSEVTKDCEEGGGTVVPEEEGEEAGGPTALLAASLNRYQGSAALGPLRVEKPSIAESVECETVRVEQGEESLSECEDPNIPKKTSEPDLHALDIIQQQVRDDLAHTARIQDTLAAGHVQQPSKLSVVPISSSSSKDQEIDVSAAQQQSSQESSKSSDSGSEPQSARSSAVSILRGAGPDLDSEVSAGVGAFWANHVSATAPVSAVQVEPAIPVVDAKVLQLPPVRQVDNIPLAPGPTARQAWSVDCVASRETLLHSTAITEAAEAAARLREQRPQALLEFEQKGEHLSRLLTVASVASPHRAAGSDHSAHEPGSEPSADKSVTDSRKVLEISEPLEEPQANEPIQERISKAVSEEKAAAKLDRNDTGRTSRPPRPNLLTVNLASEAKMHSAWPRAALRFTDACSDSDATAAHSASASSATSDGDDDDELDNLVSSLRTHKAFAYHFSG